MLQPLAGLAATSLFVVAGVYRTYRRNLTEAFPPAVGVGFAVFVVLYFEYERQRELFG